MHRVVALALLVASSACGGGRAAPVHRPPTPRAPARVPVAECVIPEDATVVQAQVIEIASTGVYRLTVNKGAKAGVAVGWKVRPPPDRRLGCPTILTVSPDESSRVPSEKVRFIR